MKSRLFIFLGMLFLFGEQVCAQSYRTLWKEVEVLEKKDYPESAIKKTDAIYRKALGERNLPQMMRACLTLMKQRDRISPDSFYVDIQRMEHWTADSSLSVCDEAVLHSLLGEVYATAAQRGTQAHRQLDKLPEDMAEWSYVMYQQRAYQHYMESVKELEKLCECTTREYAPITYYGDWSSYYNHDLMHLIGRRAVFGLQSLERLQRNYRQTSWNDIPLDWKTFVTYPFQAESEYDCVAEIMRLFKRMQQMLSGLSARDAWLLMNQNRINIIPNNAVDLEEHIRVLEALSKDFEDCETNAVVLYDLACAYGRKEDRQKQLQVVRKAIKTYPTYGAINLLRNMENEILLPGIHWVLANENMSTDINTTERKRLYPGDTVGIKVSHRNLNRFKIWIHRVELPIDTISKYRNDLTHLKEHAHFYAERDFSLRNDGTHQWRDTLLQWVLPESGVYLLETIAEGKASSQLQMLSLSRLFLRSQTYTPERKINLMVLDAKNGHPVPYAQIVAARRLSNVKGRGYSPVATYRTDSEGCVSIKYDKEVRCFRAFTSEDSSMLFEESYSFYVHPTEKKENLFAKLFSDRHLYRPGQTLFVKGIVYKQHWLDSLRVESGRNFVLTLSYRGKELSRQSVRSNEFGSVAAEFILPTSGLNGSYELALVDEQTKLALAREWVTVEEYKRPTFEVRFDSVRQAYAMGDTVWLRGEARTFSGLPVVGAKVSLQLWKSRLYYKGDWTNNDSDSEMRQLPDGITDGEGRFELGVYLEPDERVREWTWWHDSYRVRAAVTSLSGETREEETQLHLSSCPLTLIIQTDNLEWMREADHAATFQVLNLSNVPMETRVHYQLLRAGDKVGASAKILYEGVALSNQSLPMEWIDRLPSGVYELKAKTALDGGRDSVETSVIVTLFSEHETKVPLGKPRWYKWLEEEFAPGEPARLQFGVNEKNVYVVMDIATEEKLLESRRFVMSDTVQTFTFDYLPEYGKGLDIRVTYVKDGRSYSYYDVLNLKKPEKKMEVKWITFRDKLRPGQIETWTLSVASHDGRPVDAEVLASMYDASLDELNSNYSQYWYFDLYFPRMNYSSGWEWYDVSRLPYCYSSVDFTYRRLSVPSRWKYDDFVDKLTELYPFRDLGVFYSKESSPVMAKNMKMAGRAVGTSAKTTMFTEAVMEEDMVEMVEFSEIEENKGGGILKQWRENFNETAFFQPSLRTDSAGRVQFSFTLPESYTRWKFRALAHTQEMGWGYLTDYVQAQKEFMVQPNLPRFVRVGDETTITALITNLSGHMVSGKVRMELLNPITEEVVFDRKTSFEVAAGGTGSATFAFTVKTNESSLLVCRIVADGEGFSDGEQRYLPVLDNKVQLTESLPFLIKEKGTTSLPLKTLFNEQSSTATRRKLTVEYVGNPAWLAVQALPAVAEPEGENALSWAVSYYAGQLAGYIVNAHPRIKTVFDAWRAAGAEKETLWSNLKKNEELKTILLEETPWLAEAEDETEQQRRVALLFDLQLLKQKEELCLKKLQDLQTADGGWSWYKGMNSNRYVTTYIVTLLERLNQLTGQEPNRQLNQMWQSATDYLNRELQEEYKQMLKSEKDGMSDVRPSEVALQYLYSLAIGEETLQGKAGEIVQYMTAKLPALRSRLTIQGKALSALILQQHRATKEASEFMKSILEYTVSTPDMGRYFDRRSAYYSWCDYRIPTQVAVIEALEKISPSDTLLREELKQWLLVQKRTQSWDTPTNTADAVYALLMRGDDWLGKQAETTIWLDKQQLQSSLPAVAGLNYVKHTLSNAELKKYPKVLRVEKKTDGVAWGAVYAQFAEELEHVEKSSREVSSSLPFSVERIFLVERVEDGRVQWETVSEKTRLHPGDKLISRLVVKSDRDMEFVQLKDARPACAEPCSSTSAYYRSGLVGYYQSVKDASTHYFFDRLPKGTYTIDQEMHIDRSGTYQTGIATIQSAYAPEFTAHSSSEILVVE